MTEPTAGTLAPYRHVVVGVDGSDRARRAARSARVLAEAMGAALHLFRADLGIEEISPGVAEEVEVLAGELGAAASTAHLGRAPARPAKLIAERVAELGQAVACVGSHGRGAIGAALLGSTTSDYLAWSGRATVVYGPEASAAVAPERVALCVDGSEHATALLAEAVRWARILTMPLVVVRASSDAPAAHDEGDEALVGVLEAEAGGAGAEARGVVVRGHDPRAALVDFLGAVPTVGVLATHGRSSLAATMLGGTAGAVVRDATGPLVLRRPPSLPVTGM
ncbi:MAG: hypothetical protein GEV08_25550 [Acidimicrobiia bacterium]|nr:hypothetical protein [Acidimicrobiia bacterium]